MMILKTLLLLNAHLCFSKAVSDSLAHFCFILTGSFEGPPLFGLYPNGLYPNGLSMIGLSPFGLPMTLGLSPFGLFWTTGTFRLQGHLDYRHLDYRRLDYFGLQGRLDYKDIWTTAVWTTKTNRLKVFRPLGLTEISD